MLFPMPADVAPLLLLVAASAVILGTVLQRVSGMGVGLVVSPTLALLLGPVTGVLLTNITTVVSAVLIGITLRHDIDWQRYRRLALLAGPPRGRDVAGEHRALAEAALALDVDGACRAMRAHLEATAQAVLRAAQGLRPT